MLSCRKLILKGNGQMEKNVILQNMVNWYHKESFTSNYCFGYKAKGVVYAALVNNVSADLLAKLAKLDRASSKNGGGYSIKYKMNKETWEFITTIATDVKVVCSEEYLEECYRNSRKNRGNLFEEMTANLFGGVLDEKPNTSFRDGGDFYINGVPYQAKYMGATYTNETTMHNMGA